MNENKVFRNNLIAVIAMLVIWGVAFGLTAVYHLYHYRGQLITTDYLSILVRMGLIVVFLILFGGKWKSVSLRERFERHPQRILAFLILGTACFVFYTFICGTHFYVYEDIGTDLRDQYIPIISMVIHKIQNHDYSFWAMNWGFGIDMLNQQSTVMDIFNVPAYIVGAFVNLEAALFILPFIHVLKCYLCGLFCYKFLDQFSLKTYAKVLTSYLCAFCGFIILWGQHYFFASICVWMMLIFWQIEKYLRGKKNYFTLVLSIAIIGFSSLYMTYMVGLAAAVYALFRLAYNSQSNNPLYNLALAGRLILAAVTGLLLSAVVTIPMFYQLTFVSARLDTTYSAFDVIREYIIAFYPIDKIYEILLRFYSNNLAGVGSYYQGTLNYYEQAQYYFSYMGIIFLGMYFVERIFHSKKKIFHVLSALMIGYAIFMPMSSLIFNRFVVPLEFQMRYNIVMIPMLAYATAYVLSNLRKLHPVTLLVGIAGVAASVIFVLKNSHTSPWIVNLLIAFMVISMVLIIVTRFVGRAERTAILLLGCLLVVHAAIESRVSMDGFYIESRRAEMCENQRSALTRDHWMAPIGFGRNSIAMINDLNLPKDTTTRIEKNYSDFSVWNDSIVHDYMGTSYYNTTYNRYGEDFIQTVWPEVSFMDLTGFSSFRSNYDNTMMASLMNVEYILSNKPEMANVKGYELVKDYGNDICVYRNTFAAGLGMLFENTISEEDFRDLELADKRIIMCSNLVLEDGAPVSSVERNGDFPTYYKEHGVQFTKGKDSGHLQATVKTDKPQYLMVSVVYDDGWTAYVDGKETEIQKADIGFQAIKLDQGEHEVEFVYHTPWLNIGKLISLVGLGLFAIELIAFFVLDKLIGREE